MDHAMQTKNFLDSSSGIASKLLAMAGVYCEHLQSHSKGFRVTGFEQQSR